MKLLTTHIFFLVAFTSTAQVNTDSLRSIWNDENLPDSAKCNALKTLIWEDYYYSAPDSALHYADLLYHYASNHELDEWIASAQMIIGAIHTDHGNYREAMECYLDALEIREKINDQLAVANVLIALGNIKYHQEENELALDYYRQCLSTMQALGNERGVAKSLINIGNTYFKLGILDSTQYYYEQSLILCTKIEYRIFQMQILGNLGLLHEYLDDFEVAMEYYTTALGMYQELGDHSGTSAMLTNIGSLHTSEGNYTDALANLLEAYELAQQVGHIQYTRAAAKALYELYKLTNKPTEALAIYEAYIILRDSILNEENQKEIIRQEFEYELEKQHIADSLQAVQQHELDEIRHQSELDKEVHQRYALYGGIGVLLVLAGITFRGYRRKKSDNMIITNQKQLVEEKNQEITDSISYAKRIQEAILPPARIVNQWLPNSFILYKPKDIVAGDFYWLEKVDDTILFAAADCTGHGVPGAMVSVVCHNAMNRAVREFGLSEPGKILDKTNELVEETFIKSDEEVKDGMDLALCSLSGNTLQYAGAHNPLWLIRNGEIIEIKADKQPIGSFNEHRPYATHTISLQPNDAFYIFSDGFIDQFGGDKGKKFKARAFRELILSVQGHTIHEQRHLINDAFENWRGELEQVDDVCVIGVRFTR